MSLLCRSRTTGTDRRRAEQYRSIVAGAPICVELVHYLAWRVRTRPRPVRAVPRSGRTSDPADTVRANRGRLLLPHAGILWLRLWRISDTSIKHDCGSDEGVVASPSASACVHSDILSPVPVLRRCRLTSSPHEVRRHAEEMSDIANEHGFPLWIPVPLQFDGRWRLSRLGRQARVLSY